MLVKAITCNPVTRLLAVDPREQTPQKLTILCVSFQTTIIPNNEKVEITKISSNFWRTNRICYGYIINISGLHTLDLGYDARPENTVKRAYA